MNKHELDDKTYEKLTELSEAGEKLLEQGKHEQAINRYNKALDLLPKPVFEWEAATWLYAAVGDVYWELGENQKSFDAFYNALRSPGGVGNPFIHLRMGQLNFEYGDLDKTRDELIRAYMGAGEDIFKGEDPKYYSVIKDLI